MKDNQTNRKTLRRLKLALVAIICLTFSNSPAQSKLGVNVNGQWKLVNWNDVSRTNTEWIRGFIDIYKYTNSDIQSFKKAKNYGYKVILNVKFDYSVKGQNSDFPSTTDEINSVKDKLSDLYDNVWNYTDIIIVGNELFIEAKNDEQRKDPLVKFYKAMLDRTITYRVQNSKKNTIYLGAINNLWKKYEQTKAVDDLLRFIKGKNLVTGVDLHIHHKNLSDISGAMNYVDCRLRDNQKIIITEYSLMQYFKPKLKLNITPGFADKYGYSTSLKVYQYIDGALKNPVSRNEWVDFFKMNGWYKTKENYISNSYDVFKSYSKFSYATYALRQSYPFNKDFTASTDPWVLNPLYVNRTVVKSVGKFQFNHNFIDDFRTLPKNTNIDETNLSTLFENNSNIDLLSNIITERLVIENANESDTYDIVDLNGRILLSFIGNTCNINNLQSGMYILINRDSQSSTKIMVRK
ncbi:MAG: hypothetical protein MI922_15660 [Bacteroidales bacterium]|nr:hypothetical protein [Bacteroidales bacterium]